ncbi:hypothetical protein BU14_0393s0002 [Porphyra umbilicalis]|uniref:DEAD/DEAH-box helicase domain-containing protein n=1 Tax=Porphyra umbilicalis TaxID=2786 RepID=A0A1X6NWC6_PORUM|nr:hypothetical protein BU14_0393s0002 [Porphyra umbilicalis]|eukprot:OSX72914.1 hypothetical protein BU14_0393s0002 [Porphyra umbilicalis]
MPPSGAGGSHPSAWDPVPDGALPWLTPGEPALAAVRPLGDAGGSPRPPAAPPAPPAAGAGPPPPPPPGAPTTDGAAVPGGDPTPATASVSPAAAREAGSWLAALGGRGGGGGGGQRRGRGAGGDAAASLRAARAAALAGAAGGGGRLAAPASAPVELEGALAGFRRVGDGGPAGGVDRAALPAGTTRSVCEEYEEVTVPAVQRVNEETGAGRLDVGAALSAHPGLVAAFRGVPSLNRLQSAVFPTAFASAENLLVCAPTGAGKTNVALLTILREVAHARGDAPGAAAAASAAPPRSGAGGGGGGGAAAAHRRPPPRGRPCTWRR